MFKIDKELQKFKILKIKLKIRIFLYLIYIVLDDTRCGLDVLSLHRTTSIYIYIVDKFRLLSCHRDTFICLFLNKLKII